MHRVLASLAFAGAVFFLVAVAVGDVVTPGQEPVGDTISALVHGPVGWLVTASFVVHGLGDALLGGLLWQESRVQGRGRVAGGAALLLGLNGLGLVLLAFFATDLPGAETTEGRVHVLLASASFVALGAGIQGWTWAAGGSGARSGFPVSERTGAGGSVRWLLRVLAIGAGVALLVFGLVLAVDLPGVGLAERVVVLLNTLWLLVVSGVRALPRPA